MDRTADEQGVEDRVVSKVIDIIASEYMAVFKDAPGSSACTQLEHTQLAPLAQLVAAVGFLSDEIKRLADPTQLAKLQTTVDHLSECIKVTTVPSAIPAQLCEIRDEMKKFTAAVQPSLARKRLRVALQRAEMADLRSVCREISDARSERRCYHGTVVKPLGLSTVKGV
jgi:hypothetical protein